MTNFCKLRLFFILAAMTTCANLFACNTNTNGFIAKGNETFYYENEVMQTGWKQIDGFGYYFCEALEERRPDIRSSTEWQTFTKGCMETNVAVVIDNKYYVLGNDGKMFKNKWLKFGDNIEPVYIGNDGYVLMDTTQEIDGKIYTFDEHGWVKASPFYSENFANQVYNFYLNTELPKWLESGSAGFEQVWILEGITNMHLEPYNDGLHLIIQGIARHFHGQTSAPRIKYRISTKDENGVTSAAERYCTGNAVKPGGIYGETTYVEWNLGRLPWFGCNIDVDFSVDPY